MKTRKSLLMLSVILLACSIIGTWYFGYKYYWWIYYPTLGKTMGGPFLTPSEQHVWTYGLWIPVILGVLSLIGIIKSLVHRRKSGR